jgi:hypothetical protein
VSKGDSAWIAERPALAHLAPDKTKSNPGQDGTSVRGRARRLKAKYRVLLFRFRACVSNLRRSAGISVSTEFSGPNGFA